MGCIAVVISGVVDTYKKGKSNVKYMLNGSSTGNKAVGNIEKDNVGFGKDISTFRACEFALFDYIKLFH